MDTSTPDFQSLNFRVEKLERQNRMLKLAGMALLLSAATVIVMAQARPTRTVEAERFILRDAQGRQRLAIGTPRTSGAAVGLAPDEPAIWITGTNGTDRTILSSEGLRFADEKGKPLADFTVDDLSLSDPDGRQRIKLSARSRVGPSVELDDEQGFSRASLNLIGGQPLIVANDSQGFSANLGSIDLVTTQTGEQHRTSAASLVLLGKDGKVIWSAPR